MLQHAAFYNFIILNKQLFSLFLGNQDLMISAGDTDADNVDVSDMGNDVDNDDSD